MSENGNVLDESYRCFGCRNAIPAGEEIWVPGRGPRDPRPFHNKCDPRPSVHGGRSLNTGSDRNE